jgi:DNA-directed RNA polymerase subunit RPC12/RpoP|nr:MAG: hypothetical protein [Caudoviricetes sp.]
MKKVISSVCDDCDSEFNLSFNENLVKEHEDIFCPFCGTQIETIEEDIPEEEDYLTQEEMWD